MGAFVGRADGYPPANTAIAEYDHIYMHQIGPDKEGGIRFYQREVLPRIG